MRGRQAAKQILAIKSAITKAATRGQDNAAREIKRYAVSLTSLRGYSLAQMAKDDHPFATRHGAQQNLTGGLYKQSGDLARSWSTAKLTTALHPTPTIVIKNKSAHAEFPIFGTKTMVARRIDENIKDRWNQILEGYVFAEIQKLGITK